MSTMEATIPDAVGSGYQEISSDVKWSGQRIPLESIFNQGRDYLFSAMTNRRDFSWTEDQAEELFENIADLDQSTNYTLDLGLIILTKENVVVKGQEDANGRKIGKNSNVYDVHDGQQRLVTLSLLLAAIRDVIMEDYPTSLDLAEQLASRIYLRDPLLDPICRIELRETGGNNTLHTILSRIDPNTGLSFEESDGRFPAMDAIFPEERSWRKRDIPQVDQLLMTLYKYFLKRVRELKSEDETRNFGMRLVQDVYLMVTVPSDVTVARNIVMNLGKGLNTEPVDYFKEKVCFGINKAQEIQTSTFHSWNMLCSEVGRDIVEATCLLLAQRHLKIRLKRNNEDVMLDRYLRGSIYFDEPNHGELVFKNEIAKASRILYDFREGNPIDILAENCSENPPSLSFLRNAASLATCKEIEMVVIDLLMLYFDEETEIEIKQSALRNLKKLESVALWMMFEKPKPNDRFERCLSMMSSGRGLTTKEKRKTLYLLRNNHFGKPADQKKAAVVLERINEYNATKGGKIAVMPTGCGIEYVLPQTNPKDSGWNDTDATVWKEKLGNLALLDRKSNTRSRIRNKTFHMKKVCFQKSPYPLTRDIAGKAKWDKKAVQMNHRKYLSLILEAFFIE